MNLEQLIEIVEPIDTKILASVVVRIGYGWDAFQGLQYAKHIFPPNNEKTAFMVFSRNNVIVFYAPFEFMNHAQNALRYIVGRLKDDKQIEKVVVTGNSRRYQKAEFFLKLEEK